MARSSTPSRTGSSASSSSSRPTVERGATSTLTQSSAATCTESGRYIRDHGGGRPADRRDRQPAPRRSDRPHSPHRAVAARGAGSARRAARRRDPLRHGDHVVETVGRRRRRRTASRFVRGDHRRRRGSSRQAASRAVPGRGTSPVGIARRLRRPRRLTDRSSFGHRGRLPGHRHPSRRRRAIVASPAPRRFAHRSPRRQPDGGASSAALARGRGSRCGPGDGGVAVAATRSDPLPPPPIDIPVDAWAPYWTLPDAQASLATNGSMLRQVSPFWYSAHDATTISVDGNLSAETTAGFVAAARAPARVSCRRSSTPCRPAAWRRSWPTRPRGPRTSPRSLTWRRQTAMTGSTSTTSSSRSPTIDRRGRRHGRRGSASSPSSVLGCTPTAAPCRSACPTSTTRGARPQRLLGLRLRRHGAARRPDPHHGLRLLDRQGRTDRALTFVDQAINAAKKAVGDDSKLVARRCAVRIQLADRYGGYMSSERRG